MTTRLCFVARACVLSIGVIVAVVMSGTAGVAGSDGSPGAAAAAVAAQAEPAPDDPGDAQGEPSSPDIVPKPGTGEHPDDPGDRGGALQVVLFVAVLGGIAAIATLAVREARR